MVVRSLLAGLLVTGVMITGSASAQVLLCPPPPELSADKAEMRANAATLLKRLLISLDLYGHEGIDESAIARAHADTPGALLSKLGNVADRCSLAAADDLTTFYKRQPELRRLFLEATLVGEVADIKDEKSGELTVDRERHPAFADLIDAVQSEQSAELSARALWRKLWFRSPSSINDQKNRWAVIIASPADADEGWAALGKHQKAWEDVYFQLHQPYYEHSNYHAIVVGRKLPQEEAEQLLDYVIETGMAEDSYIWPVPIDNAVEVASSKIVIEDGRAESLRKRLDLSVLNN